MRSLQDEIRQAQKDLSCPICARTFQLRDIRIRTFTGGLSAELSVVCSRGHFPVILLVPVNLRDAYSAGPVTDGEVRQFAERVAKAEKTLKEIILPHDRKN